MPRTQRFGKFETRTARNKLTANREHWAPVDEEIALGYRRGKTKATWYVRTYQGAGKYAQRSIGLADDYQDADGENVLTYFQAADRARQVARQANVEEKPLPKRGGLTVSNVLELYLEKHRAHSSAETVTATEHVIEGSITPRLGKKRADELTTREIRAWHHAVAKTDSDDPEAIRKRKATANRQLTVLKAALNYAWSEGEIENRDRWQRVKPFRNVDAPKVRFLSRAECRRLINASTGAFRDLVRAAVYTGCRYGELARLKASDYDPDAGTISIMRSKSGKARHVPLTGEGVEFFDTMTADLEAADLIFTKDDGTPWGKAQQCRRMRDACEAAKISPAVSFHILRHTYGSLLARKGVPLQVIASALGHADTRMTERHYAHLQPDHVAQTIRRAMPKIGTGKGKVRRIA